MASSASFRGTSVAFFLLSMLVVLLISVGGITRLTESGLSITEWKPVVGIMPPTNTQSWENEFDKYKETNQYRILNSDMTLSEFKKIYLMEYSHRLLARSLVIAFFAVWILLRKNRGLHKMMFISLILILSQGVMGWIMVRSGLNNTHIRVSQYGLMGHFTLALGLLSVFWYEVIRNIKSDFKSSALYTIIFFLICIQMLFGSINAGLKSALVYNTFPLMDGDMIPDGMFRINPIWRDLFENVITAQFLHRVNAIIAFILSYLALILHRNKISLILAASITAQFALGVFTVLFVGEIHIGILHQLFGVISFLCALSAIILTNKSSNVLDSKLTN